MPLIELFIKLLKWREPRARPLALEASPLRKLPAEPILLVASYLPPESAASLAISCYALHSLLEAQCVRSLKTAELSVLKRFLHLLALDLPNHILCPRCNKFHSMSLAKTHVPSQLTCLPNRPSFACRREDARGDIQQTTLFNFSSTIFRMAMKAHQQGNSTSEFLNLLSYGTINFQRDGFVEQCSFTVRIYNNSLLICEQRIFMIPSSQKVPVPWYGGLSICAHIKFITMLGLYKDGIHIPYSHQIPHYINKQGVIFCDHCFTEFRVDFKSYGEEGNAMFITRWMDLGEGRDVNDIKWTSRLWHPKAPPYMCQKVMFRRGSICAAFEGKPESEFRFDEILSATNEKELRKGSPWGWPENVERELVGVRRFYEVRDGRFVPLRRDDYVGIPVVVQGWFNL